MGTYDGSKHRFTPEGAVHTQELLGELDKDTVEPTRKITNILIWIFALVMAYPYLPGSHTEAFKGMSVLVGLMISLGASSVVGQGASGLILMYSRTLRTGEYVRIGEHEGTIVNISLFTTRLRTGRGAEITLPNALIVGSATRNYSRTVTGEGSASIFGAPAAETEACEGEASISGVSCAATFIAASNRSSATDSDRRMRVRPSRVRRSGPVCARSASRFPATARNSGADRRWNDRRARGRLP